MNTKILSIVLITAFLTVSMLSAIGTSNPISLTFTGSNQELPVTLNSLVPGAIYDITVPTNIVSNVPISFTVSGEDIPDGTTVLSTGDAQISSAVDITATTNYNNLDFGVYSGDIIFTKRTSEIDTTTDSVPISVEFVRSFCKNGEQKTSLEELEITDVKIDNRDGDDEEWGALDKIEIEVEVSNNGDDKIKDVFVELGLFNSDGKNIVKDLDRLDNKKIDLGSIKDGDEDVATFTFTIPADFKDESYKLVLKAYSDDIKEENLCTAKTSDLDNEFYQTIDGVREEDEEKQVIFDNIQVSPSIAKCGERVQITGEIFNIGDQDYEDQVRITLFNQELGLNQEKIVREDLDIGESEVVEFEFNIQSETAEKLYTLEFRTYYDYDTDDDEYDVVSDDKFLTTFRVEGDCEVVRKAVQITADFDSETPNAVPGKQMIVNANVKNTGDTELTYTISVSGYSAWSSLVSIEPQTVTLSPGDSREVSIVLEVNADASGEKEFTISVSHEGQVLKNLEVRTTISKEKDAELGPVVSHLKDNWFIYLIILVNIILIIAIILVIRSMVSPRPM